MRCCCKNPDHVAVASRADSSVAPKANHMGDRGFEDDKAAIQKWREQHDTISGGAPKESTTTIGLTTNNGATDKSIKPNKSGNGSGAGAGSSGSDSSNTYHLESNETKNPIKVSTEAVYAWQQSPQRPSRPLKQQSQPSSLPTSSSNQSLNRPSLKQELRSPFEVVSSGSSSNVSGSQPIQQQQQGCSHTVSKAELTRKPSPRSQSIFRTALLDDDETAIITPDTSPATTSPSPRSTPSPRLQQEHRQLDALVNNTEQHDKTTASHHHHHNDDDDDDIIPPPSSPARFPPLHRGQRRHDHEGLRDQLIRDVVLRQQASSGSSLDETTTDKQHEKSIQGNVFLQVHPNQMISPRSSLDDNDGTSSDIFSDPALEEVANSLANDTESRERYILACRLLRGRITQRNPPPILPLERELLQDLRDRFQSSRTGGSAIAFEALSKLLEEEDDDDNDDNDNYNSNDNYNNNDDVGIIPIANSRSNSSRRQHQHQQQQRYYEDLDISHDVSMDGELTVASIREEETGFNTVLKHHHHHHQSSWRDEKNPKAMPELVEEEELEEEVVGERLPLGEASTTTTESLIRLDGWNSSLRDQYPFEIMGLDQDTPQATRVLTPAMMEALLGFVPYGVSEDNYWLKYSLVRDGASLQSLLRKVMASQHTILCVETNDGEVFGSFCSSPWRNNAEQQKWFGTGEAFLWKLKQPRYAPDHDLSSINNEMEVYPYTGNDDMVQYCTSTTLAVGGGSWNNKDTICPYPEEPHGIGLLLDGDLEGGETNSCATFANPRLYGRATSSNEFTIQNCEVWTLTPMNTVHAAEQLERQKYFLQEHTVTELSPMRPNSSPRRGRPPLSPRR